MFFAKTVQIVQNAQNVQIVQQCFKVTNKVWLGWVRLGLM